MAYATPADFAKYGLPSAALDGFGGTSSDYLDAASDDVDTYLRSRHDLPLATPYPAKIIQVTCELAAYSLLCIRGFDPESPANRVVEDRAMAARKWLELLSQGKVNLAVEADATPATYEGGPSVRSKCPRPAWG